MITPYNSNESKVDQVKKMFNHIAPSYDQLNRIISLGLDKKWRKKGIKMLSPYLPQKILDLATGTGDLAIDMVNSIPSVNKIIGADISDEMMRIGSKKVRTLNLEEKISFQKEDALKLSFEDGSFDAITIAFGIRNFEDIPGSIKELKRVLKEGKPLMILELTEPKNRLMRWGYKIYSGKFIPFIGNMISNDANAYSYLPKSITSVPQRDKMVKLFYEAGFTEAYYKSLVPGTCAIYMAIK